MYMYSPFVNKQCTRIHKARLVDMPNRHRLPLHVVHVVVWAAWIVDCRLDKQDDQRQLQLSSFKRMPSVVALWETKPKESCGLCFPLFFFLFSLHNATLYHDYGCGSSSSSRKPISQKTKKA